MSQPRCASPNMLVDRRRHTLLTKQISCKACLQVAMMLVRSTLGIPLPIIADPTAEMSDESSTDGSQGSSAILSELDRQDSFAPDTPPQNMSLLGMEITSRRRC